MYGTKNKIFRSLILKQARALLEETRSKELNMQIHDETIHELSYDERAVWGECPVCHARPGESCHPEVGILLGVNVDGKPPENGAHLGRLQKAPFKVRIVSYD
jgi:hypothetical protein